MMEVKEFVALAHCKIHVNKSYWAQNVPLLMLFLHFIDSTVCILEQPETKCSGEEYMITASGEVM